MSKDFINCVNSGGKVVTEKLKGNKYRHVCYDKNGTKHNGEIKVKKGNNGNKKIKSYKVLIGKLKELERFYNSEYHI